MAVSHKNIPRLKLGHFIFILSILLNLILIAKQTSLKSRIIRKFGQPSCGTGENDESKTAMHKIIPTPKPIPESYMKKALDPYYQWFQPVAYDKAKDRFYFDKPGYTYAWWRTTMGIDYVAWTSISTLPKGILESATVTIRYEGRISELDTKRIEKDGRKFLYYKMEGNGTKTEMKQNENNLMKAKFYKMVSGNKIPIKMEGLKNGDLLYREEIEDLTKPPKSPDFEIEQTFIVL